MKGFRVPHFGYQYTEDIYKILNNVKYNFSSSRVAVHTTTQGFPYKIRNIWEFPLICCPKHPFCIFDTSHAFRSKFSKHDPREYIETFEKLLELGIENNMFLNIYQDPQDINKFDYNKMLSIIDARKKDLWITTYNPLVVYLSKIKRKDK